MLDLRSIQELGDRELTNTFKIKDGHWQETPRKLSKIVAWILEFNMIKNLLVILSWFVNILTSYCVCCFWNYAGTLSYLSGLIQMIQPASETFLIFCARIGTPSVRRQTIIWTNAYLLITTHGTKLNGIVKKNTDIFCEHLFSFFVEIHCLTWWSRRNIMSTFQDLVCKMTMWASSGYWNRIWNQALFTGSRTI